mmetsp:Transcript_15194/g.23632  ORF Transcript_15194/g.23632 Transcript_15194/m.23632 type:complete len:140 (-) Transcript_15194:2084-2503(-)
MVQQPRTETVWYTVPSTVKQTKNNWNEDPVVNNIADEYSNASLDSSFNGSIGLFVNAAINGEQSQKQHPSHYDSQRSTFLRTWWKKGKTRVMASLASELQVSKFNVASSAQELLEDSMILGADEAGKESNGSYASALMT